MPPPKVVATRDNSERGQGVHCYAAGRLYPPISDEFHRDRKGQVNMMNGEFCPGWYGRSLPPPPITEFDRAMFPWTTGLLVVSAAAIAARVLVGMIGATRGNTSPAADPQSITRMVARCAAVGVLAFGLAAVGAGCFIHHCAPRGPAALAVWGIGAPGAQRRVRVGTLSYDSPWARTGPSGGPGATTGCTAEKSLRSEPKLSASAVREVTRGD